ncbi:MAG TPA: hypothetical protein VHT73_04395 [Thermodesulfobacteriota bacterium]|nr:hypothetical protein [Thermodesulfobacteriota bacterium]
MAKGRWKETEILIREIQELLIEEYPVTLRQLFYCLVSKLVLQNERKSYQKLSRVLTDARNNGDVPFDRIVDRSKVEYRSSAWEDLEGYLEATARDYRKDRWGIV